MKRIPLEKRLKRETEKLQRLVEEALPPFGSLAYVNIALF